MDSLGKSRSHGRIGEAAVFAKCWMHGIPAYSTGGLRSNFAGSDLIVETADPRKKLWVQVKTGASTLKDHVYLTQGTEEDLSEAKFKTDFVVFVDLDLRTAKSHSHDGTLDFSSMSYYVVPVKEANRLFRAALERLATKPKRDGTPRKLTNIGVVVPNASMEQYRDAWDSLKSASGAGGS